MNDTERLLICDNVHDVLEEEELDLDDKLSVLASVILGLIHGSLANPIQRQIHLTTLCTSMQEYLDEAPP